MSKTFFCTTRLMTLCHNLNEVMQNSLFKTKIGCHGNKLDKIMPKYSTFHKFLNLRKSGKFDFTKRSYQCKCIIAS